MQTAMEEKDGFENLLVFSDKPTFRMSGKVNRHNVRIWGTEKPRLTVQHELDSPKVNVFAAMSKSRCMAFFLFHGDNCDQYVIPQYAAAMVVSSSD